MTKRARPRRAPKPRALRRRSRQPQGFAFVGDPLEVVCPFCPGGETVVTAGDIQHVGSTGISAAVLHPEPTCAEYMKNDPADFLRLSREHYEQHGKTCDKCDKRMIPSRPHSETMAEARQLWGEIGPEHMTLCDSCFALEVQARAKGTA